MCWLAAAVVCFWSDGVSLTAGALSTHPLIMVLMNLCWSSRHDPRFKKTLSFAPHCAEGAVSDKYKVYMAQAMLQVAVDGLSHFSDGTYSCGGGRFFSAFIVSTRRTCGMLSCWQVSCLG